MNEDDLRGGHDPFAPLIEADRRQAAMLAADGEEEDLQPGRYRARSVNGTTLTAWAAGGSWWLQRDKRGSIRSNPSTEGLGEVLEGARLTRDGHHWRLYDSVGWCMYRSGRLVDEGTTSS